MTPARLRAFCDGFDVPREAAVTFRAHLAKVVKDTPGIDRRVLRRYAADLAAKMRKGVTSP